MRNSIRSGSVSEVQLYFIERLVLNGSCLRGGTTKALYWTIAKDLYYSLPAAFLLLSFSLYFVRSVKPTSHAILCSSICSRLLLLALVCFCLLNAHGYFCSLLPIHACSNSLVLLNVLHSLQE